MQEITASSSERYNNNNNSNSLALPLHSLKSQSEISKIQDSNRVNKAQISFFPYSFFPFIPFFGKLPGNNQITNKISEYILRFFDRQTFCNLSQTSKACYHAIKGKSFFFQLKSEDNIPGQIDHYRIESNINRQKAAEVFNQLGKEIYIPPGEEEIKNYTLSKEGNFGNLYICYAKKAQHYFAIKVSRSNTDEDNELQIHQTLQTLKLPNILSARDFFKGLSPEGKITLYQIFDLAGLGSVSQLQEAIQNIADPIFQEQLIFCFSEGLLSGLNGLHGAGFCHNDIHPGNVVVNLQGRIFIIDFGRASYSPKGMINPTIYNGLLEYRSPENWLKEESCDGTKGDSWGAGLTLLFLKMKGPLPFQDLENVVKQGSARLERYINAEKSKIPELKTPQLDSVWSLIDQLLQPKPKQRLSPLEALQHGWMIKMRKSSPDWLENATSHLKELVQQFQREVRQNITNQNYSAGSPQELPLPHFEDFVMRNELKQKLEDRLFHSQDPCIVCHGIGGAGKSTFINYFIHQNEIKQEFGLILWFKESDISAQLDVQYLLLAKELKKESNLKNNNTSVIEAIKYLNDFLASYSQNSGKKWLIIFDNAGTPENLEPYLPKTEGGHIIVTTRSAAWKNPITFDVMTRNESISLAKKLLQSNDSEIPTLCQMLGDHPLAICQAIAFIRNKGIPIASYLQQLQDSPQILEEDQKLFGKSMPSSLFGVWNLTLDSLPETSLELLNIISYLSPEEIPKFLFASREEELNPLFQYALIKSSNEKVFSIHRLLQLRVRYKHIRSEIIDSCEQAIDILQNDKRKKTDQQLIPHGLTVLSFIDAQPNLSHEILKKLFFLLQWLGDAHSFLGHYSDEKGLFLKAFNIAEKIFPANDEHIALSLNNLSAAINSLGQPEEAIRLSTQALQIYETKFGSDCPILIEVLQNLGRGNILLLRPEQAIPYLNRALTILENFIKGVKIEYVMLNPLNNMLNIPEEVKEPGQVRKGYILVNLSNAYFQLGNPKIAIEHAQEALTIYETFIGPDAAELVEPLTLLGSAYLRNSEQIEKAKSFFERALKIMNTKYPENYPEKANILAYLGHAYQESKNFDKALEYFKEAKKIDEVNFNYSDMGKDLMSIASVYQNLEQLDQALSCLNEAKGIYEKHTDFNNINVATLLFSMGEIYRCLGKIDEAYQLFMQSHQIAEKIKQNSKQSIIIENILVATNLKIKEIIENKSSEITNLITLANSFLEKGPIFAAFANKFLANANEAITQAEEIFDLDEFGSIFLKRAQTYEILGNYPAALKDYEKVLELDLKAFGSEHTNVALDLSHIGRIRRNMKQTNNALVCYNQALSIYRKYPSTNNPDEAMTYANLASAYADLKDFGQAFENYMKALHIYKNINPTHPIVIQILTNLGCASEDLNDLSNASKFFQEAYTLALEINHPNAIKIKQFLDASLVKLNEKAGKAVSTMPPQTTMASKSLKNKDVDLP